MDKNTSWQISAGNMNVYVALEQGTLLWSIKGTGSGMDVLPSNLGDVSVCGKTPKWTQLISADTKQDQNGSCTFTIVLENQEQTLRLTRYITVYADHPFVRTWGTVENIGLEDVKVDGCELFTISPESVLPLALFHVEQFVSVYSRDFFRPQEVRLIPGRNPHEIRMGSFQSTHWQPTSCAWFALLADAEFGWIDKSAKSGPGLVCGIEFNGKGRLHAWADEKNAHITSTIDALSHRLVPNGVFEIPAAFFGQFNGDWDEAGFVTQQFTETHVSPSMPDDRYPWAQYDSWAYDQDINEEQQLKAIDRCAELGLELVVLDLGWARAIGDWRPDPVKFPRGLKPLADRAKSYGMKFGVHVATAQCSLDAPIAKEHPEWLIHNKVDYFGATPICLGHTPCREWLIESLSTLVSEEGVEYFLQDGEDMVKQCTRTDHTHDPKDSNYSNSQYGLDLVMEELRRRHPDLVFENCEDGGCMMTYKMARLYHTSITVDNIDTYSTRQGIFGASYPFSTRYSARYMQDAPTHYTLYSSIFGGPLIFMHRVTEWNETEVEETRKAVALYKELRDITRNAKVIHLMRPNHNIPNGGWGWDAIQAVTPDKSRSAVMVYHANGDGDEKVIRPRGLQKDKTYQVRFSNTGKTKTLTGDAIEHDGILVALDAMDAEILFFDEV